MDNLLWAIGGAAVVYVLWVRPLQQAHQEHPSAGEGASGKAADALSGPIGRSLQALFASAPAAVADCGCGGK